MWYAKRYEGVRRGYSNSRREGGGGDFAPGCFAGGLLFVEDQQKEALLHQLWNFKKQTFYISPPLKLLNKLWNFRAFHVDIIILLTA